MKAISRPTPQRLSLGIENDIPKYVDAAIAGQDVFGFIGGEFSLIDAIDACVCRLGPCKLTLSTWTAAKADMDHVRGFLARGQITACRWIVDRSFQNRQPELCQLLRDAFGDDAIRVQPVHCKFALLDAGDLRMTMQTSANLNRNRRLENLNLSTCPVFFEAYSDLVRQIFGVQLPGEGFKDPSSANRALKQITMQGKSPMELKLERKLKRFEKRLAAASR